MSTTTTTVITHPDGTVVSVSTAAAEGPDSAPAPACPDPSSFSNCGEVRTTSLVLDLDVDFAAQVLSGTAELTMEAVGSALPATITLDTRDISVTGITDAAGNALAWSVGAGKEGLGEPLVITLASGGSSVVLRIAYATSATCTALQWLPPAQTAGGVHPYMFSQCQAIHARSLLPCQDSPGVRCTYTATLRVPEALTGLMSALSSGAPTDKGGGVREFSFEQPVPMASYLIAIAVGELEGRDVGPRTTVYSEPSQVEKAAWEFADTEKLLALGEAVLTPYEWGRYDILCLPPSFPYGGMENPCLTFVTPTLLAGDRSQAAVVAHEITHSWMGNLVGTATWEHFWLNEGFTRFVETKIMARFEGKPVAHLKVNEGLKALADSVAIFGEDHDFTRLVVPLGDVRGDDPDDPDDAFSSIPYEKGMSLLWYLQEEIVGSEEGMEEWLRAYVLFFRRVSLTSDKFKKHFLDYWSLRLPKEKLAAIDWDTWLHKPGMPPFRPTPDASLLDAATAVAAKWMAGGDGTTAAEAASWHSEQFVVMLDDILVKAKKLPVAALAAMEAMYGLTAKKNSEIRFRWQMLGVASGYEVIYPHVVEFLTSQGRMKFVRPLYRNLFKTGGPGKELALATFTQNRHTYHAIASKMVAKDLELA